MKTEAALIGSDPMHAALAASGRAREIPESADIYGWLIGSWELDVVGYDDGNIIHSTGEAHFAWVLEGRAVQDVFINPGRSTRGPASPKFANWYGTTIRIYDPAIHALRVNWFNPDDGIRAELIGRAAATRSCRKENFLTAHPSAGRSATSQTFHIAGAANDLNRTGKRGGSRSSFAPGELKNDSGGDPGGDR